MSSDTIIAALGRRSRQRREALGPPPAAPVPSSDGASTSARASSLDLVICAALVVLTAIVFAQIRNHEFLNFDDPVYVTNNEVVKKGLTVEGIVWAFRSFDFNWHPLTWITHMADVELFGVAAGPHLLINALLHAINAILVFVLLMRMTSRRWCSAVVAAIFAIHPLHVESVAWLSERKDVLSALLFFLTLLLYVSFTRTRSRLTYAWMVTTFILSLLAKGMPVTLPFVLLLLDWWPLRRLERLRWSEMWPLLREKLPLFAVIVAASAITFQSQRELASLASTEKLPVAIRVANAGLSYVRYLGKALWPEGLLIPYQYSNLSMVNAALAGGLLIIITLTVIMFHRQRYLATGWFWFLGILVPMIGLVQIGAYSMADRYTYVPLIGVTVALVWLIAGFVATRPFLKPFAAALASIYLLLLTVTAYRQTAHWRSSIALFSHALTIEPRNPFASLKLGEALLAAGQPGVAAGHFRLAAEVWPSNPAAHHGLGISLAATGLNDEAARALRRSVELNPGNSAALFELGRLELSAGQSANAAETLKRAAASGGASPLSLGTLALAQNNLQEALRQFQRAVAEDSRSSEARNNLGATLARMGRDEDAVREYQEALRLTPGHYDGHMNLGALLSRMDRNAEAASHFEQAAKLRPQSPEALVYRALSLANNNLKTDAAKAVREAMQTDSVAANLQFTNAVRIPFKDTNLQEFLAALEKP